uniref:Uncharacterized protein n=1 Tax=Aegilops tauschii subsp. strangulata TaxID=200361 RepID=A0A453KSU5_AEGTS
TRNLVCGIARCTYGLTTTLPLVCAVGAWVPVSQLAEHEVAAYSKLEEERASKHLDVLIDICASQRVRSSTPTPPPFVSSDDEAILILIPTTAETLS